MDWGVVFTARLEEAMQLKEKATNSDERVNKKFFVQTLMYNIDYMRSVMQTNIDAHFADDVAWGASGYREKLEISKKMELEISKMEDILANYIEVAIAMCRDTIKSANDSTPNPAATAWDAGRVANAEKWLAVLGAMKIGALLPEEIRTRILEFSPKNGGARTFAKLVPGKWQGASDALLKHQDVVNFEFLARPSLRAPVHDYNRLIHVPPEAMAEIVYKYTNWDKKGAGRTIVLGRWSLPAFVAVMNKYKNIAEGWGSLGALEINAVTIGENINRLLKDLFRSLQHLHEIKITNCDGIRPGPFITGLQCRELVSFNLSGLYYDNPNTNTMGDVQPPVFTNPTIDSWKDDLVWTEDEVGFFAKWLNENCEQLISITLSGGPFLISDEWITEFARGHPGLISAEFTIDPPPRPRVPAVGGGGAHVAAEHHHRHEHSMTDVAVMALAAQCPGLRSVKFVGDGDYTNPTSAAMIALARQCSGLTSVEVSATDNLTDAAVIALAKQCPGLTSVKFRECENLTDMAVVALANQCHNLGSVDFSYCDNMTDAGVVALAGQCPDLRSVKFAYCATRNLTDVAVVALAKQCHSLSSVEFAWCNLTDTALLALAENCPGLRFVNFKACENLTDAAVVALAEKCPGLGSVEFQDCLLLTDTAVLALAEQCPDLRSVDFEGCNLTDVAVMALAEKCAGLRSVKFGWCENLTDEAVVALAEKCPPDLRSVDFHCCNLTDTAVLALAEKCPPGLDFVDFSYCDNLTDVAVVALATRCLGLGKVSLKACPRLTIASAVALHTGRFDTGLPQLLPQSDPLLQMEYSGIVVSAPEPMGPSAGGELSNGRGGGTAAAGFSHTAL